MEQEFELIAKTFMGLEPVLAEELTQLGANNVQIGRRMVSFTGDKEMMYRANFQLHTAIRILKPIKHFKARSAEEVYDQIQKIKWFQLAADQGNEYAQYFLKHMDDRLGQPPVAAVISLFHHLANIFQEQNQPPPSGGVRVAVDRKLLRKIKAKKIAQGHKADDHEEIPQYSQR